MKSKIHPDYNVEAVFRCASCNTEYKLGSTSNGMVVNICSHCHPFYTGQQEVYVDTSSRISNFKDRLNKSSDIQKKIAKIKKEREERKISKVNVISSTKKQEPKSSLSDLLKKKK